MSQAEARAAFVRANPGIRRPGKGGYWYRCAHCGKWCGRPGREKADIPGDQRMEVDHIRPWSMGGSDEVWNLQPLCRPCNRSKSNDMTFKDGIRTIGNVITNPVDTLIATPIRRAARQNPILKGLGITKRR